jgi:soluble lytic murein transglycosylase-like protein
MLSWLMGVFVCLCLLAGCGGGSKGNLVKEGPLQPALTVPVPDDSDESALTEELSAKRLEELYAKSGIPGWDPILEEELKKWEHQVKFDVPIQMNKQVRAYLVYFSTERKEIISRYLSRSSRYLPMIKEVFQEYGLPEDLAYLAMIESGFNAKAYSHANASGMWQFIKGTGLRYGLAIDSYVDERRDPEKSTRAAAKYLLDLYKQFGSWYLSAASYNCGEGRVQRELNQSTHKNFWELSANMCLPNETKNYVPQMIAATIIAKNPEKFGFRNLSYLPPLKYDRVQVNEPTALKAAAAAVNVSLEEVQDLNPELTRGVTPPDSPSYALNLPAHSKELFAKNITLAQIEHPAIASRPLRTAKRTGHSYRGRSHAVRQASVAAKPNGKTKTHARSARKSAKRATYASKSKSSPSASAKAGANVYQASVFGSPSLAVKHDVSVKSQGKAKIQSGKADARPGETRLAKRSDSAAKNSGKAKNAKKNGSSEKKSKDKISKAKPHALFAEAR